MRRLILLVLGIFFFTATYTSVTKAIYNTSLNVPLTYKNIGSPFDMVVLNNGSLFYADVLNYRIVKLDSSGQIIRTIGKYGSGEGEFLAFPVGVTVDADGNLYALEGGSCRIDKFDFNGGFIKSWGSCGDDSEEKLSDPHTIHYDNFSGDIYVTDTVHNRIVRYDIYGSYLGYFGSPGNDDGQFNGPWGLTTDINGKIYVADEFNSRVQVFNPDRTFNFTFGNSDPGDYGLPQVKDMAVLSNGEIEVLLTTGYSGDAKVKVFNSDGTYITEWGTFGEDIGNIRGPLYIAVDNEDNIYISDWDLNAIEKFSSTGVLDYEVRNSSVSPGGFYFPTSAAYDSSGNLYVLDRTGLGGRIQKFTNSGVYQSLVTYVECGQTSDYLAIDATDRIFVSCNTVIFVYDLNGNFLFSFDNADNGGFDTVRGIDFDTFGNVYVADWNLHKVIKFDGSGNYISEFGTEGYGEGQFFHPRGIMLDSANNIYVVDEGNSRLEKFSSSGEYILTMGSAGNDPGQFSDPMNGSIDTDNNIFIADNNNHKVVVYDTNGIFQYNIGSYGGGVDQFYRPFDVAINNITNTPTVVDTNNHRVEGFDFGVKIQNLISSADVVRSSDEFSLTQNYLNPEDPGSSSVSSTMNFGDYIVSDFNVDLTADRDWESVNAVILPNFSKSLVVNLNPTDAPGLAASHSIYVVKQTGQNSVFICPDASTIADVNLNCTSGYELSSDDPSVSSVRINGIDYWKVDGLTGTGAFSYTTKNLTINTSSNNVAVSEPISIDVTALNSSDNPDIYYSGTVTFSSTSGTAILPSNFTFSSGDNGTYTFSNQLVFTVPGDYTVTVTDANDNSLTATTGTIHVEGIVPTPTETPVPTNSLSPTNTPMITSTPRPTSTPGPTHTAGPSPTVTSTPTITTTPTEQNCIENNIQAKCQVDVVISNVIVTILDTNSAKICWDTNTETKGVISYGTNASASYNSTSTQEADYVLNHCITLSDLTNNTNYIYRINSTSPAARSGYMEDDFTIGVESLPETGGVTDCISMDTASYSFNSTNQAILSYKTSGTASCTVDYGIDTTYSFSSSQNNGLNHTSYLDLTRLDGVSDLYYKVTCTVTGATNQCTNKGVIPVNRYQPYYNIPIKTATLTSIIGDYFGTPVKASSTLGNAALTGTAITLLTATAAYPQWLSYGLLWFSSRKNKKTWGLVYNALTKEPVQFAIVRAFNSIDNSFVKQSITDTQGKYGFVLDSGNYIIKVEQSGYEPFNKNISVNRTEEIVNLDIPLTKAESENIFFKINEYFRKSLKIFSLILSIIGIIFTILAIVFSPNVINIIIFVIYDIQIIIYIALQPPRGWGYIYNSQTNERVNGAFVRLFDTKEGRQIDVQMVDTKGRYGFLADDKKEYYLRADCNGYKFPSGKDSDKTIKLENGEIFIKADIKQGINNEIALDPV